jgi:sulfur-carrier protein
MGPVNHASDRYNARIVVASQRVRWVMATLLMFAGAREAAGTNKADFEGTTVGEILDAAVIQFGDHFAKVLAHSKVWLDGEPAERSELVTARSEVAVLPPVSGG